MKIFISHSSDDESLASHFVELLTQSLALDDEDVLCTSVHGHKLPIGTDAASYIRDGLGDSGVVIGLLTPNSVNAGWVLFELGAAWALKKGPKVILAEELSFADLPGPLGGRHAIKSDDESGLLQLIREIAQEAGVKERRIEKVVASVKGFVKYSSTKKKSRST